MATVRCWSYHPQTHERDHLMVSSSTCHNITYTRSRRASERVLQRYTREPALCSSVGDACYAILALQVLLLAGGDTRELASSRFSTARCISRSHSLMLKTSSTCQRTFEEAAVPAFDSSPQRHVRDGNLRANVRWRDTLTWR